MIVELNILDNSKSSLKALPSVPLRGRNFCPRRRAIGEAFRGDFSRGADMTSFKFKLVVAVHANRFRADKPCRCAKWCFRQTNCR